MNGLKKIKSLFAVLLSFILSLCLSFVCFADVNDLMISTGSNALMTMELDDSDYQITPFSSLANITNTINYSDAFLWMMLVNDETGMADYRNVPLESDGRIRYYIPSGYSAVRVGLALYDGSLPSMGTYDVSVDFASDVSVGYDNELVVGSRKDYSNANYDSNSFKPSFSQMSGDWFTSFTLELGNVKYLEFRLYLENDLVSGNLYAGVFKVNFTRSSDTADFSTVGTGDSASDVYESDVSSSLSDLSSSVDTMTDEISGVTEAIQNLQGAMEPHYSNVLTQLHHITEQLHAFYDQVYNNIHLPELDMLTQIKTAIENIDLQIEVDISEVKTAINNMSTAVQNKLQTTTDQITYGYDNSGIIQENEKLEQSINDYDHVESEIFDEAGGFVGEFEYPSVDSLSGSVIKALAFVGSFLQGVFLSMGDFGSIITFSLTMIFVMVIVGYHRIRS